MKKDDYTNIGLGISKYIQVTTTIFSLFLLFINYLLGSTLGFWLILICFLLLFHIIPYFFCDIKYNKEEFVIERLCWSKKLPANEFIRINRSFMITISIIRFTHNSYYFYGNVRSLFKSSDKITTNIKSQLNQPNL